MRALRLKWLKALQLNQKKNIFFTLSHPYIYKRSYLLLRTKFQIALFQRFFFLSNINTHELTPSARYTDFLCGDDWRIVVVGYGVAAVFAALGIDEMNTII